MNKVNLISIVLAAINPILGLISSLLNIIRFKDTTIPLSFSIALIAIYFPIMYDTASNFFQAYYSTYYGGGGWGSPYLSIPSYFMYKFGYDFYLFIFIYVFFVVYTWSNITLKIFSNFNSNVYIKATLMFIFLTLMFNYRDLMDINRSIFSFSIFFYYVFLVKKHSLFKFILFSALSIYFHNSALIIVLIYTLSVFKINSKVNLFLVLFSLVIGFSLPFFISKFQSYSSSIPIFGPELSYYLYGDEFAVQTFTLGTALKKTLNILIILFSTYIAMMEIKKDPKDRNLQFIINTACFCLLFYGFVTFFERVNLAFNFALIYLLSKNLRNYYLYFLAFLIALRSLAVYFLVYFPIFFGDYSLVVVNNSKKNDMIYKVLYCPSFYLLDIHKNGYSDQFILSNVRWGKL